MEKKEDYYKEMEKLIRLTVETVISSGRDGYMGIAEILKENPIFWRKLKEEYKKYLIENGLQPEDIEEIGVYYENLIIEDIQERIEKGK